jgi:hypothetical protein
MSNFIIQLALKDFNIDVATYKLLDYSTLKHITDYIIHMDILNKEELSISQNILLNNILHRKRVSFAKYVCITYIPHRNIDTK